MPVSQSDAPASPKVNFVRDEVQRASARWTVVRDCLGGAEVIKRAGQRYLPMPNAADQSAANIARYHSYVDRAVFYNVTRRTIDGWNGQVFARDPLAEFPGAMDELWSDISGTGASIDQQAKRALGGCMAYGRGGLLVDYPAVPEKLSIAEIREGGIRPTIQYYPADSIINWRTIKIGAAHVYSLIVLRESSHECSDGFSIESRDQLRILKLVQQDGDYVFVTEIWQKNENDIWYRKAGVSMRGPDGKLVNRILFFPFGISENTLSCDLSPAYDLAVLNIGHYRNSADYEESCFIVGQPTPVLAGLTQEWVDDVLKGTVELGSRACVPLPVNGTAMLLQVNPNTMTKEAMIHKEAQMVAIGARIIQSDTTQKTLGQSQNEDAADNSILATAAKNVSAAYSRALACCGYLMGLPSDPMKYKYSLNTDFPAARLTPNERAQLIAEWQAGAITQSEMRAGMRRAGVATLDSPEYAKELAAFPPPQTQEKMQQGKPGEHLNKGDGGGNQAGS